MSTLQIEKEEIFPGGELYLRDKNQFPILSEKEKAEREREKEEAINFVNKLVEDIEKIFLEDEKETEIKIIRENGEITKKIIDKIVKYIKEKMPLKFFDKIPIDKKFDEKLGDIVYRAKAFWLIKNAQEWQKNNLIKLFSKEESVDDKSK